MLTVTRVRSPRDVRRFVDFDLELYQDEPRYAPPLRYDLHRRIHQWIRPTIDPKHQAALFLVARGERVVGRISASIDHRGNELEERRVGAFGFLEAIDDAAVFGALFGAAEEWLVEHGVEQVLGPYSFVQEDPYVGLLVSGFEEEPTFRMTWSLPYYPPRVEALGYRREMDLRSYVVALDGPVPAALAEKAETLRLSRDAHITVRRLRMNRVWEEAKLLANLFNAALHDTWEFVPLTDEQVRGLVSEVKLVVDPRLVLIAEADGEPVGCVASLPDYNDVLRACGGRLFPLGMVRLLLAKRRRERMRGHALAVLPGWRRRGLGSLLVEETFRDKILA